MLDARTAALGLYYYTTYPYRWWSNVWAAANHRLPVVILFYHRMADEEATPWTISNRSFGRQLAWLLRHFELISLEEAQHRIRSGRNSRPCVSLTFDDGYSENCQEAIPLLVRERIPFTYFVTAENVLLGKPFSHDGICDRPPLPNNLEQLRAIAGAAGVEIGCHTYSHPDLGPILDERRLRREVVDARDKLQEALGNPVRYFAFPFGQYVHLSSRVYQMARDAGFLGVCSAYGGYNVPGDDPFHLQRTHADPGILRLRNVTTIDPRKRWPPRFRFSSEAPATWRSGRSAAL